MALTDTIQCDGVTTSFTLTRAVTTKESLSLTIASGDDAGLVVSPSDYTFSPVNSVSQSVTITWANAVNYGTVGTPVDVTVAIYHNPGADPADTLLYSYDSASAMRPEMVGRDLEHVIDLIKMVIGGADLATTSLGDQEDDIAALDVRLDAAETTIVTHTSQIAALDTRLDALEPDVAALQANDAIQDTDIDDLQTSVEALGDSIGSPVGVPTVPNSVTASEADSASPLYVFGATTLGVGAWMDLIANVNKLIADATTADSFARWAGGARIQGGANRGDIYTTGSVSFKEGNFIDGTNTPTATEFASYYAGGTVLHIYPPTGTDKDDYVFTVFNYNAATEELEGSTVALKWATDHWLIDSTDAPFAIFFLRVT